MKKEELLKKIKEKEYQIEMFIENKIQENYDSIDFNTKAK